MMKFDKQTWMVIVCVLTVYSPADAWYKQAAGPSYYSVGRASGLLSGIRRSPFRRAVLDSRESDDFSENNAISETNLRHSFALANMPVCVQEIAPELQSCELVQDATATFRCAAAVVITLDSRHCLNA